MSLQKTEASAGTAHIFFEESQLQLMFCVFEVAIVVPLFPFFRQLFICTIPRFAHSLFNVGLLLSSLGSSEGAPPPLQSCFWLFIRISSRVESSCECGTRYFDGRVCRRVLHNRRNDVDNPLHIIKYTPGHYEGVRWPRGGVALHRASHSYGLLERAQE